MRYQIRMIVIIVIVTFALIVTTSECQAAAQNQNTPATAGQKDSDRDGIPDIAERILGTNPYNPDTDGDGIRDLQDKDPVFAENPIKSDATQQGFKITEALVENNVDPVTKKAVDDHLEVTLQNIAGKDLSGFKCYYTITDVETKKKEGYIVKLSNFVLKSGETKTIHFDNKRDPLHLDPNHFGENPNSMYRTNGDAKIFDLLLSVPGFKVETVQIKKDPGSDEKAD
jgi:hypothetical protein